MPILSVLVTAAAAVKATNGSCERQYSSGRGPSAGLPFQGVSRLVGMWLCSGNHNDSNPRSSQAWAKAIGWIALSVGNISTPISTITTSQVYPPQKLPLTTSSLLHQRLYFRPL